jgi:hypothetical protein
MAFQATIKEVTVELVVKGKTRYSVANVAYDYKGEARTQKLVSFANPGVFDIVKDLKAGDVIDIETTKNAAGYTEWAKVTPATGEAPAATASVGKVTGSNYETAVERAENRVRIVRQSCLGYAINTLTPGAVAALEPDAVIELAQFYVDWVYGSQDNQDQAN